MKSAQPAIPISKKRNIAVSINAVGFHIMAKAKKIAEIIIYFLTEDSDDRTHTPFLISFFVSSLISLCTLFSLSSFFLIVLIITKPERRAKSVRDKTHRSVLLSINTKKAPIPLVNHKRIRNHEREKNHV